MGGDNTHMNNADYQREVIAGIASIKQLQTQLARTAERQIELLERLVEVEHTSNNFKDALNRVFVRLDTIETEVDNWRVMRKLITWLGPAGVIAVIWVMVNSYNLVPTP